ncbi:MAG TPA: UDP-N-acetylmuramate--L-alanine ligase, partial [Hellea balneolensis]|nr:UDP-N-acetylmuramate--L-alanine ligase [Hellea balneolensis]
VRWPGLFLPMAGHHNVQNATAAIVVAYELGIPEDKVRSALAGFGGVKRRFTKVGEWEGVTIIDDYGHHPVEIKAVLKAARQVCDGRIHAVVQPHRFTRVQDLFEDFCSCFNDADAVYVTDIYAAGEDPIKGIDSDHLAEGIIAHGHRHVQTTARDILAKQLHSELNSGDMVVCLGAGDITVWAANLADELRGI